MKITSTTALAVALALGMAGAAVVATPAVAEGKKEEAAKGPDYNLSKPVARRWPRRRPRSLPATTPPPPPRSPRPGRRPRPTTIASCAGSLLYELSQKTNDPAAAQRGVRGDARAAPGCAGEQRKQVLLVARAGGAEGGRLRRSPNSAIAEALKIDPDNRDAYALLAETQVKAGKPAEAVAMFQQAMASAKASGPEAAGRTGMAARSASPTPPSCRSKQYVVGSKTRT